MKFRIKPVVIEAYQWHKETGQTAEVICNPQGNPNTPSAYKCETLEGWLGVSDGDWIITGVQGEHYPCKPDIFEQAYEPVE